MKKQVFNLGMFLLSMGSFGFWELEGPFGQVVEDEQIIDGHTKKLLWPIECLNVNSVFTKHINSRVSNIHGYVCMYNKQTGYSIGYVTPIYYFDNSIVTNFFLGNNDKEVLGLQKWPYFKQLVYESSESIFYFVKENQDLDLDKSLDPIVGTQLYIREKKYMYQVNRDILSLADVQVPIMNDIDNIDESLKRACSITILSENGTSSGVIITNKEEGKIDIKQDRQDSSWKSWLMESIGIKVKQENPPLDFQVQLVKYFDKDSKNTEFAMNLGNSILKDGGLSARKLNTLKFASRVGEWEIKKLKNSRILAVYGVAKNDSGQDGIIWGLAEDLTTPEKRRFHWITDLENDVSCLLKQ